MPNYEDRIVLFLDILGFKKIIEETLEKDIEVVTKTTHLAESLMEMTKNAIRGSNKTSRVVSQFSDSIVISFLEDDITELKNLFSIINQLVAKLLAQGYYCRGAISYGKLYHKNNIVFGPALVDAYETESQAALYPRIILDHSIVELMKFNYSLKLNHEYRKILFEEDVKLYLSIDSDDKFYINYFTGAMLFFEGEKLSEIYSSLRKDIINGLRFKSPSIKIKYGWMKNKFNKIPKLLININNNEDIFQKRPDIEKLFNEFKPIKSNNSN